MGSVLGSCAGAMCASCGCAALDKCCGAKSVKGSRVPYTVLFFLTMCLSITLRYWGQPLLVHIYYFSYELCSSDRCLGYGAVFRVSLALSLFHLLHAAIVAATKSKAADQGYWLLKLLLFLVLLIGRSC
jgi:hypothetical protein